MCTSFLTGFYFRLRHLSRHHLGVPLSRSPPKTAPQMLPPPFFHFPAFFCHPVPPSTPPTREFPPGLYVPV